MLLILLLIKLLTLDIVGIMETLFLNNLILLYVTRRCYLIEFYYLQLFSVDISILRDIQHFT